MNKFLENNFLNVIASKMKLSVAIAKLLNLNEITTSKPAVSPRNDNKGFTLAEVLITLDVIGVVSAMTLPTVIKK